MRCAWPIVLGRTMQSMLFGTGALNLPVVLATGFVLLLTALAACYVPARRLIPVARLPIRRGERVWQPGQPLAEQRVEPLGCQARRDLLEAPGVSAGSDAVVRFYRRDRSRSADHRP